MLSDPHVSRDMGETILDTEVGTTLRWLLRRFGSPRMVLTNIAKVAPKFTSVATMRAIEHGRRHVVVTYRLHDGKQPHRLDCDANIGLLSATGPLFGLPRLDVEHVGCQVNGADECVYVVRWPVRRRLNPWHFARRRRDHLAEQVESLRSQVESLESVAADLVSSDDKRDVLQRIVARAASAVTASRFVLAIQENERDPVEVFHDGFTDEDVLAIGEQLLRGEPQETGRASSSTSHRRDGGTGGWLCCTKVTR